MRATHAKINPGPVCEAGLSTGMQKEHVPPRKEKERKRSTEKVSVFDKDTCKSCAYHVVSLGEENCSRFLRQLAIPLFMDKGDLGFHFLH